MTSEAPSRTSSLSLDDVELGKLTESEMWWRNHSGWLLERGYLLRPRYRPGWEPSWKADPHRPWRFEDWVPSARAYLLDATRMSDQSLVMLKQVKKHMNPYEVELTQYVTSVSDPRNHCVPLLDVLPVPDDPDTTILVMPLLRECDSPAWDTLGEAISFLRQVFEGLQWLHEHHVAHRDCIQTNIMYDPQPMYPKMFHPRHPSRSVDFKGKAKHTTRTWRPVKYYFIDFGLSRRYHPEDDPPREHPIRGGDKSVPEFQNWNGELLDPFPTDIYYLGNAIRTTVLQQYQGVDFLSALVTDMTQADPLKRPTISNVTRRFERLVKPLGRRELRARLKPVNEDPGLESLRDVRHTFRTIRYILFRRPAVPVPS